ncbi:MAG TPA: hypothetical protein VHN16_00115 [Streptosporangiaceae bacterium]|nr:hypothetical protein [Streptosporangiaceae bacterium]
MLYVYPVIRPYHERDLAAVYAICVQTADGGGDARGQYRSDDLMPDLFAGPYVFLEPQLAFVLDDGRDPVGYVLGTADTAAFARAYREQWIPRLAGRYPVPPQPPVTPEDQLLALHYRPERLLCSGLACPNTRPTCTSTCCLPSRGPATAAGCLKPSRRRPGPARPACMSASSRVTSRLSASTAVWASGR